MAVNPKSLENLEKGKKTRFRTGEAQVKIAKMGAEVSNRKQAERKTMRQLAEICLGAKLTKPELEAKLKEAGLPPTYGGQMLFNAIQKAGVNSNMLRVLLELTGELKQAQTNVTVTNVNPYVNLTEEELRKLANIE